MSLTEPLSSLVPTRKAEAAESQAVAETLAAAFYDDPVLGWALPDPVRRREILPDFFELLVEGSLAHDEVYTTDDIAGAALWLPPAALDSADDDAELAAAVEQVTGELTPRVLDLFAILDEVHPHEPHYYLPVIGTRPEGQGRGIGSALLVPTLQRCDDEALPAYLEATSERNRALYARHGFRVTGEIRLPDGPTAWSMWREPSLG